VEAFLSVAAADELGVTPSAVSQAVRARGARQHRALHTHHAAGEKLLSRAKPAFEELVTASAASMAALRRRDRAMVPQRTAARIEIVVSGPLIASDFPTVLGAALEGIGLAQVSEPIAAAAVKARKLVQVLEKFAPKRRLRIFRNNSSTIVHWHPLNVIDEHLPTRFGSAMGGTLAAKIGSEIQSGCRTHYTATP